MTKQFNMNWNSKRIFAWNGEKYTTYFLPGNQAMIDSTGTTPHSVNGPLTAGIIPWGFGDYSYENLSLSDSSAIEKIADGQPQIHLTLNKPDGLKMLFILAPQKNYAVLSCLIYKEGNMVSSRQYSDFRQINAHWIPNTTLIENFEPVSQRLLTRDIWEITQIDANVPQQNEFEIEFQTDALIEHSVFNKNKPEVYRYSQNTDINLLLAERMEYKIKEGTQPQNCATAALKYALSKLGKNISDQQLAQLVNVSEGNTSLYDMKQFVIGQGLSCRAARTNIETLRNLHGCQAILYLPSKKHFVVLESVDDKFVWLTDLSSSEFYYHKDINFFDMDWSEGITLLISNNSIQSEFDEINNNDIQLIIGAGYQCIKLLQEYDVIFCVYIAGDCGGLYTEFPTRYGCQSGTGSCSTSWMIRYIESPCILDPYFPTACDVTGDWTSYDMRACA